MRQPNPLELAFDSWSLGWEAWTVIGLRLPRLLAGDRKAMAEAQRMVVEKIEAAALLQWRAMTGGLGSTPQRATRNTVAHYRKAVRQNHRRLTRS